MTQHKYSIYVLGLLVILLTGFGIASIVHYVYITSLRETNCKVITSNQNNYTCCKMICSDCESCSVNNTCDYLKNLNKEGRCCNGKYCCGSIRRCIYYRGGRCVSSYRKCVRSVDNRACIIKCPTCFDPIVGWKYYVYEQQEYYKTEKKKECGESKECVESFLQPWPLNSNHTCWYDIRDIKHITFDKVEHKWLYWITMSIGVGALVTIIWILSQKYNNEA